MNWGFEDVFYNPDTAGTQVRPLVMPFLYKAVNMGCFPVVSFCKNHVIMWPFLIPRRPVGFRSRLHVGD